MISEVVLIHHWNFWKYSWMSFMAKFTSLHTASSSISPRTTHPCVISKNSTLPVFSLPNFLASNSKISPPGFTLGGSFTAGRKKAGHLISLANLTSSPPNIFSTPSEGCGPAIAMNSSYLTAILKACQTPQQNPTAKNCFTPLLSKYTLNF